jgi:tetratricopeptide (TPR) repeat protein
MKAPGGLARGRNTIDTGSDGIAQEVVALSSRRVDVDDMRRRALEAYDSLGACAQVAQLLWVYVAEVADDAYAWFMYGDSLRAIGRFREAEQALLTTRELAPIEHRSAVEAQLGMLETERGALQRAEEWFQRATADAGCPGWVWVLRGENLLRMESVRLARDCLSTALKLSEVDREEVLLNLALAARYMEEYEKAAALAQEALAIDPDYSSAKELLVSLEGAKEASDEIFGR